MSLTAPDIQVSTKTPELYLTALGLIVGGSHTAATKTPHGIFVVAGLAASFVASRAIYKAHRAVLRRWWAMSEVWATVFSHIACAAAAVAGILPSWQALVIGGVVQVVFNVGQGHAKGVGVKTQVLLR